MARSGHTPGQLLLLTVLLVRCMVSAQAFYLHDLPQVVCTYFVLLPHTTPHLHVLYLNCLVATLLSTLHKALPLLPPSPSLLTAGATLVCGRCLNNTAWRLNNTAWCVVAVPGEVVGRVPRASAARAGGDAPSAVPDRRALCDQEADCERDECDQGAGQGGGGQPAGPPTPS